MGIDDALQVELEVRPCVVEAEGIPRKQRQPARSQDAAARCRDAEERGCGGVRRHVNKDGLFAVLREPDCVASGTASVFDMHSKKRAASGEYRLSASSRHLEVGEIAKGIDHGVDAKGSQQERQDESEAQGVIDRADDHRHQHQGEDEPLLRRQDVHPPLDQHDRTGIGDPRLKQPVVEPVLQHRVHRKSVIRDW